MSARASIMHLDLDCFFASVEIKLDPELSGKPVLVGGVNPQGKNVPRGVVATASYEARKFGCKSGMPLFKALQLCPDAIVVGGHYEEYVRCSRKVMQIAARYAPLVQQVGIDEAFLDFSQTEVIYPDLPQLPFGKAGLPLIAEKIRSEIKNEVGITASIGLARTKVVAKVASDFNKPDGFTFVPAGSEKEFLAPLPLRELPGIGHQMEKHLVNLLGSGSTIGDFARLSVSTVTEKFGGGGANLWNAANGIDNIWFEPRGIFKKSISRSETFYSDRADEGFILAMLRKLTESVGEEVRSDGYLGRCIHVYIRYADFRTLGRQRVLPYSTNITKEIYDMGELLLKELWDGKTALRLVGISLSDFQARGQTLGIQMGLFEGTREKRLELEKRIDSLRNKFGKDSVKTAAVMKINS